MIGVRFSPGPCNYMEFEGIDAIEGTYTITLGALNEEFELIRLAATNNPTGKRIWRKVGNELPLEYSEQNLFTRLYRQLPVL